MKLQGKTLTPPKPKEIILRGGEVIFKVKAVLNFDEFEKRVPKPEPPEILKPGNIREIDFEDPEYNKKLEEWAAKKTQWMFLESLSATEGLEWDTVDISDSNTWANWAEELSAVLTPAEVNTITQGILEICGLSNELIEEARERFLAGRREAQNEQ